MRQKLAWLGIVFGLCAPLSGWTQDAPTTIASNEAGANTANDADFQDYKQRLFTLIGHFKRYRTTVPDIEAIMGADFRTEDQKGGNNGWIIKVAHGYKSLRMNHRVSLYYGEPMRPKPLSDKIYFETQYYVNFSQAEPQMAMYLDEKRCLSMADLEAALTQAKLKYEFEFHPESDEFYLSVGFGNLMAPDSIYILAVAAPQTIQYTDNAHKKIDPSRGCVESVSIS